MKDEILKHLYNVRDAALAIKRFIEGKTFDDYKKNARQWQAWRLSIDLLLGYSMRYNLYVADI
ncbi:MAG: hypothetical protein KKI12_05305 [Proteobacteria bacterium]|nr:hypothetical protein [Pseudomonadota bacterium]MBU4259187.1 hypothetical protein [Pseudomonadota bacterium]MBU4287574.1 hypothetical protein [Pseudomonadota bacterium]MCG2757856.1 hypothetical protein [Desulfobacteraceae bacterium]